MGCKRKATVTFLKPYLLITGMLVKVKLETKKIEVS